MTPKIIHFFILIYLLFASSSCSSFKLAYNWTDVYLDIKIDAYFDVTSTQQDFLDIKLKSLHTWHRKSELPKYIVFLQETQQRLQDGAQKEDLAWFFDQIKLLNAHIGNRMASDTAEFLSLLSAKQVEYLKEKLAEENKERLKRAKRSEKERFQDSIEKIIEGTEEWLGALSDDQKRPIEQLWQIYWNQEDLMVRYRHRIRSHERFMVLLKKQKDTDQLGKSLLRWYLHPEYDYSEAYKNMRNQRLQRSEDLILLLNRIVTKQQKEFLNDTINKYINQMKELHMIDVE